MISICRSTKISSKQEDSNYEKFNSMIISPPSVDEVTEDNQEINDNNQSNELNEEQFNQNFQQPITQPMRQSMSDQIPQNGLSQNNFRMPSNNPNEEYVYVPTPVDPAEFAKLKQNQGNQMIDYKNMNININPNQNENQNQNIQQNPEPNFLESSGQFLVDEKYSNMIEKGNMTQFSNLVNQKAFDEVVNSDSKDYAGKIDNLINLQQKDYEQYFSALNNLEYQKVFNSLNKDQESKIYQDMMKSNENLDYNSALNNFNENRNFTNMIQNNETGLPVIDLPGNKKEIEDSYSKVFEEMNTKNSMSFIQKNKDIKLDEDGKTQMFGKVDSKVNSQPFKPEMIGRSDKTKIHPKDYVDKSKEEEDKNKEKIKIEIEKREKENYPRFKTKLSHEIRDEEEEDQINFKKQQEFEKIKNKIEGTSFVQQIINSSNKENIVKALDHIIKKRNKSLKEETKRNLNNCNKNCNSTCKRVSNFRKNESEESCQLKCHLGCTENSLNKLLK